jgi:hypothetical protein
MKALRRFLRLPPQEGALVVRAFLLMVSVRLGLWLLPFPMLLVLTRRNSHRPRQVGRHPAARISWAVHAVSRYVPGATCLVQALTAKALLESAGIPACLHIGVARGGYARFEAHAWVECQGAVVIGASGVTRFTPLLTLEARG